MKCLPLHSDSGRSGTHALDQILREHLRLALCPRSDARTCAVFTARLVTIDSLERSCSCGVNRDYSAPRFRKAAIAETDALDINRARLARDISGSNSSE